MEPQGNEIRDFRDLHNGFLPGARHNFPGFPPVSPLAGPSTAFPARVTSGPAAPAAPALPGDSEPPFYRMSRSISSVVDLWHEWTVGFGGGPPVDYLDRRWGSRWRSGCRREIQWYSLRLEIIREIRRIAQARNCTEDGAVQLLQERQDRTRCSVAALCKKLRAERKQRCGAACG